MSEKSRRNYPFIGRIYTAEQIDNLIGSIDLSDYYNKSDIDGMLDIIETAIDAKQDELTAGDNITIENNVISAVGGDSNWELLTTTDWSSIISISGLDMVPLKDFMLYFKAGNQSQTKVFFKDVHYGIVLNYFATIENNTVTNDVRSYMTTVYISTAGITASSISANMDGFKISTVDGTITAYTNFYDFYKKTDNTNTDYIVRLYYKD